MFQYGFSFIMEYPKTCKVIGITIVILRFLAISYLIYVLANDIYSLPIEVLVDNINIGITAVLLILDLLLLYGSFRQISQFLVSWASCSSTLLIYDIINFIRAGGLTLIIGSIIIIIFVICLYFVAQTAREWRR